MSEEIWRLVPGFPDYEVSDMGRIKSFRRKKVRVLNPHRNNLGYSSVVLFRDGNPPKQMTVHRIVMLAFVGPCPERMEVCHSDANPRNNQLSNLRYDTHLANMREVTLLGKKRVIFDEQAKAIKEDRQLGVSTKELAERYRISERTVRQYAYPTIDREPIYKRAKSIREDARECVSYKALSKKYGLGMSHISMIVTGKRCIEAGGPIKGKDY